MKVRTATVDDAARILAWMQANAARNGFDPEVLRYETTDVAVAENGAGPVAFLPVQLAAVLESFAPDPAAGDGERAQALFDLLGSVLRRLREQGVREAYFVGCDPETNRYAERIGFEKLPWPVYRVRL